MSEPQQEKEAGVSDDASSTSTTANSNNTEERKQESELPSTTLPEAKSPNATQEAKRSTGAFTGTTRTTSAVTTDEYNPNSGKEQIDRLETDVPPPTPAAAGMAVSNAQPKTVESPAEKDFAHATDAGSTTGGRKLSGGVVQQDQSEKAQQTHVASVPARRPQPPATNERSNSAANVRVTNRSSVSIAPKVPALVPPLPFVCHYCSLSTNPLQSLTLQPCGCCVCHSCWIKVLGANYVTNCNDDRRVALMCRVCHIATTSHATMVLQRTLDNLGYIQVVDHFYYKKPYTAAQVVAPGTETPKHNADRQQLATSQSRTDSTRLPATSVPSQRGKTTAGTTPKTSTTTTNNEAGSAGSSQPQVDKQQDSKEPAENQFPKTDADYIQELLAYKDLHGHCNVPCTGDTEQLGMWVVEWRKNWSDRDRARLEFQWGFSPATPVRNFLPLSLTPPQPRRNVGHLYGNGAMHPQWSPHHLALQYQAAEQPRTASLSLGKRQLLTDKPHSVLIQELETCNLLNGKVNVASASVELREWLLDVRKGRVALSVQERARMEKMGIEWEPGLEPPLRSDVLASKRQRRVSKPPSQRIKELQAYRLLHGPVLTIGDAFPELRAWLISLRQGRISLSREERTRLEDLGVEWEQGVEPPLRKASAVETSEYDRECEDVASERPTKRRTRPPKTFLQRLEELSAYKAENGDCNVTYKSKGYGGLARWAYEIRNGSREITKNERSILDSMGFFDYENLHDHDPPCDDDDNEAAMAGTSTNNHPHLAKKKPGRAPKPFLDRVKELAAYKAKHGDCNVNYATPNPFKALGSWAHKIRNGSRTLMDDERAVLEAMGFFDWKREEEKGDKDKGNPEEAAGQKTKRVFYTRAERIQELTSYKEEHGDCLVRRRHNQALAAWCADVRAGRICVTTDEKKVLDDLGFNWDPKALRHNPEARPKRPFRYKKRMTFEDRVEQFVAFKKRHDTDATRSETKDRNDQSLSEWIKSVRIGQTKITEEQKKILDSHGFDWEKREVRRERRWNEQLDKVKAYKARFGDCFIPYMWPEDKQLWAWCNTQRQKFRKGGLPKERQEALEAIDFCWTGTIAAKNAKAVAAGGKDDASEDNTAEEEEDDDTDIDDTMENHRRRATTTNRGERGKNSRFQQLWSASRREARPQEQQPRQQPRRRGWDEDIAGLFL